MRGESNQRRSVVLLRSNFTLTRKAHRFINPMDILIRIKIGVLVVIVACIPPTAVNLLSVF